MKRLYFIFFYKIRRNIGDNEKRNVKFVINIFVCLI
jgi:hypothetical protein